MTFSTQEVGQNLYAIGQGYASANARAKIGALGVTVTGLASGTESNVLGGGGGLSNAKASALWSDVVDVSSLSLAKGKGLRVKAALVLDGNFSASFNGGDTIDGNSAHVEWTLGISGSGVPAGPYNGWFARGFEDLDGTSAQEGPPNAGVINVNILLTNRDLAQFRYEIGLSAQAKASANHFSGDPAGTVSVFYNGDFGSTLKWGGIQGVFDVETGEEITDWTITSESGFDYSQPYVVPEPASAGMLLMLAGLGASGTARARRFVKRHGR